MEQVLLYRERCQQTMIFGVRRCTALEAGEPSDLVQVHKYAAQIVRQVVCEAEEVRARIQVN
jgi:hypothetical protein